MFTINNQPATGLAAEAHYINWCLALEQENKPVPRTALAAMRDFQEGAFRDDAKAAARIEQSGVALVGAKRMRASEVTEGDTIVYLNGDRYTVERITEAKCDGSIGMHGNDDTWSTWFKPTDFVRVERSPSFAQQ